MALESTAINDLIAGLQSRPLRPESDDWLFSERDDATQIDPRFGDDTPFEPQPPIVPLPQPFQRMPAPAIEQSFQRPRSPTAHVRTLDVRSIAKKLLLPIGAISIVSVALAVYVAKSETTSTSPAIATQAPSAEAPIPMPVVTAAAPVEAAEPLPDDAPVDVEGASLERVRVEAVVTPIEPDAEKPAPSPAAAPAPEPPPVVDPDSPAGRILAPPPVEPTFKSKTDKPAPAPTTVPDLRTPDAAPEKLELVISAKPQPAPAKKRKSLRQLRAEKRAAAKAAARASIARSKARAKAKTGAVDEDDEDEAIDDEPAVKPGKGILSITSTPPMEVWVDGRNSNAMTPVRIILLAGKHKVTLFDKDRSKAKSFSVVIKANETTKVVKTYR